MIGRIDYLIIVIMSRRKQSRPFKVHDDDNADQNNGHTKQIHSKTNGHRDHDDTAADVTGKFTSKK